MLPPSSPFPEYRDLTYLQLWKVESTGEDRKVTYLSTLIKHTQAVNVVRFSPKGMSSTGKRGTANLTVHR
jgi:chromatin assembly factor 1 subunit B